MYLSGSGFLAGKIDEAARELRRSKGPLRQLSPTYIQALRGQH